MNQAKRKLMMLICAAGLVLTIVGCSSNAVSGQQEQSFDAEQVQEIKLTTEGQNIQVRPSKSTELKVSTDSGKELPVQMSGSVLTIDAAASSGIINFKTGTVFVDLPEKMYRKISLKSSSGSITGNNVKAEELVLQADSGNIEMNGFEGGLLRSELVAGDMSLNQVDGALAIDNDTGHVKISHKGNVKANSSIRTSTGKIELSFLNKPQGLQLNASSESGKIQSSLTSESDVTSKGAGQKLTAAIGSNSSQAPTLTIMTSSGHITLK
ncbi:DUF4097 family beta strand repeat-containing protein [Paenibacillus sp. YYML68]|uniref:DUF4097 family beta strand repeat-containing protein n=1 Tax=Paenibacillus sp. YYML68 TaxID=2909250 RepID=UPI002493C652|nr:DUF4097 family beta strand repeat-containing protein [Paenibacillus sp. YYML68]